MGKTFRLGSQLRAFLRIISCTLRSGTCCCRQQFEKLGQLPCVTCTLSRWTDQRCRLLALQRHRVPHPRGPGALRRRVSTACVNALAASEGFAQCQTPLNNLHCIRFKCWYTFRLMPWYLLLNNVQLCLSSTSRESNAVEQDALDLPAFFNCASNNVQIKRVAMTNPVTVLFLKPRGFLAL